MEATLGCVLVILPSISKYLELRLNWGNCSLVYSYSRSYVCVISVNQLKVFMIATILVTLAIVAELFVALLAILFYNRNLDVCKVTLDSCKCSDLFLPEIGKCAWFLKSVDRHANLYIIIIIIINI